MPSPGYRVSGKEVEVCDSGYWHHQLCGCCNLQLIQSHVAPSHGPPARVLPPLSSWQSLSCYLSCVAKRSTPKPHGPLYSPSEPCGPLPFPSEPCGSLLFTPEPCGPLFTSEMRGLLHSMAAGPRFKSQCPSSFAAPFPTPPTVSYTCQHPRILPAVLGCHSKSGQVWPHGMEPIISKLSRRPCNQGELLPSAILGGIRSHPPG